MIKVLRNIKFSFIALAFFFSFSLNSQAITVETNVIADNYVSENYAKAIDGLCGGTGDCGSIFGNPEDDDCPAYWLQWILDAMKYVAIVALLALSVLDFVKALVSNDKDAVKKAGITTAKRFIYCVIIFFLPIIVDFIMRMFGAYGTCGIE